MFELKTCIFHQLQYHMCYSLREVNLFIKSAHELEWIHQKTKFDSFCNFG